MSSNAVLLSNVLSPLANSLEAKSNYTDLHYKLQAGLAMCSKQRREIQFTPALGSSVSINLLKYGLATKIYMKLVINDASGSDLEYKAGNMLYIFDEIFLSSHSKIIERLDPVMIHDYILKKAKSHNDNVLALTGFSATDTITTSENYTMYIPLPFSFFGTLDKAKDLLHLQQITLNVKFRDSVSAISAGGGLDFVTGVDGCAVVQNFLELPSAKLNELWDNVYSAKRPTNQLLVESYKENANSVTLSASLQNFTIPVTTKGCVVKSYIMLRQPDSVANERAQYLDIEKITFRANGTDYFAVKTDEMDFEKIIHDDHYHSLAVSGTASGRDAEFNKIYCFDFSVVGMPATSKYSQAVSMKNISSPEFVIQANHASITSAQIDIVHVILNLVSFNKADGSVEQVLSV